VIGALGSKAFRKTWIPLPALDGMDSGTIKAINAQPQPLKKLALFSKY
jgi:hypothetical protein